MLAAAARQPQLIEKAEWRREHLRELSAS